MCGCHDRRQCHLAAINGVFFLNGVQCIFWHIICFEVWSHRTSQSTEKSVTSSPKITFYTISCQKSSVFRKVCFRNPATRWCCGITLYLECDERDSAPTKSPSLHYSSTLGSKMIHLDSTNHSLIPNMIVLKFISWAELDVIVNCNEWCPFVHCKCMTHYIMVWKQMYFLFALF